MYKLGNCLINIIPKMQINPKIERNLKLKHSRFVIAISHSDFLNCVGGTELCLLQEKKFLATRQISYIQISPACAHKVAKKVKTDDLTSAVHVNLEDKDEGFYNFLDFLDIISKLKQNGHRLVALQLHHCLGWSTAHIETIVRASRPPRISIFIHDYFTACAGFNFLRNDRFYCSAPAIESHSCLICKHGPVRPSHWTKFDSFFDTLERLSETKYVSPSQVAADIWAKAHPKRTGKVEVIPHKIQSGTYKSIHFKNPHKKLRVAFVGYSNICKGYLEWIEASKDIDVQNCCELLHLGACGIHQEQVREIKVSFQNGGPEAMVVALKENQIDVAVLCSIWPETFSFTCFEALTSNCLVLTRPDSGNIAKVVSENPDWGIVLTPSTSLRDALCGHEIVRAAERCKSALAPLFSWNEQLAEDIHTTTL